MTLHLSQEWRRHPRRRVFSRCAASASTGFTLMEVLATMVLIGIVLPAVMRGVSVAMQSASYARHIENAAALGEAKLNEVALAYATTSMESSGDFGPDWPAYRWTLEEHPRALGAGAVLGELVLTVHWMQRGDDRSFPLTTLVYDSGAAAEEVQ